MKNIISAVLMIAFVAIGVVAADFLKPAPAGLAEAGHTDEHGSDAVGDDHKDGHEDYGAAPRDGYYYYDFGRQFVVPVMQNGKVGALVILDINLELDQGDADGMFSMEPKFRDALMRELLALSNEGLFTGQMTDPDRYETIQKSLLRAARTVKDEVRNVLILDIARQDQ